jgi:hypothetical protein
MEVITEYGNYWDLKDHSWSGALDTLADIEKADKEDELMDFLEEVFADRTPTDTEVNDLLWHDREYVYENVGLNENGEIPTVFDEVQEDTLVNELDLENMKESEIFSESILSDLEEQINSNQTGLGHLLKEDIETEEQAEWVRDNL